MSTLLQTSGDRDLLEPYDDSRSLPARERILGHVLLIAVILLAIYLRSL